MSAVLSSLQHPFTSTFEAFDKRIRELKKEWEGNPKDSQIKGKIDALNSQVVQFFEKKISEATETLQKTLLAQEHEELKSEIQKLSINMEKLRTLKELEEGIEGAEDLEDVADEVNTLITNRPVQGFYPLIFSVSQTILGKIHTAKHARELEIIELEPTE